jgi:hypothetical protein
MKRYEDASREFEESIRLNPNLFDVHYCFPDLLCSRRCRRFRGALASGGCPRKTVRCVHRAVAQDAGPR